MKKLEEKKLEYLGTDIIATKNGFQIEVNLKGDWKRGKPKFIADIISVNGNIIVNDYKLDANPLVKAFVNKDDIDGLASTMGDSIKKYIETDRKKEIERLDIEDGILKVTYKS